MLKNDQKENTHLSPDHLPKDNTGVAAYAPVSDMRLVFMGTPEFAVPSLEALLGQGL